MEGVQNYTAVVTTTGTVAAANKEVAAVTTNINNVDNNKKPSLDIKKRGGINLLRVALFMLRRKTNGKSTKSLQVEVASKGMWRRLVGSMRTFHLHDNNPSPRPPAVIVAAAAEPNIEKFEDVFPPPISPHGSSSSSSCDDGMSSRYASAVNLQELDDQNDDDDQTDGDYMIDAKAEEFIAQFYEQMRLQRLESVNRYNEMIARGLR